jgi:NAD(P)-dependent dehydrogenase (short-subunit alcohol dehydrogenase family)
VVIADVKKDQGLRVADELSSLGDIRFVATDISKSSDVQNLIEQTVKEFGKLDVAINNAAMSPDKTSLTEFDESYWRQLLDVNLTGTALCCKYQMQQFQKQNTKGSIVNIASINAFMPQPNMPAYTSAKHALIGLTKHAATEGGPSGIRVNAIAPGAIFVCSSLRIPHPSEIFGRYTNISRAKSRPKHWKSWVLLTKNLHLK